MGIVKEFPAIEGRRRWWSGVLAAVLLGAAACGGGGTTEPPPPRTVAVQAPAVIPNPVIQHQPFSATVSASAQHTVVDSILLRYGSSNPAKITGTSGSASFIASVSGQVCATAHATGATPNTRCTDLTVSPVLLSVDGTLPPAPPLINTLFAVSVTATAQHAAVDSVEALYRWIQGAQADSARLVARGTTTLAGSFTARRPGTVRFRAYSKDALTAEQTRPLGVHVPILLELRALYRDDATNAVTDSLDRSSTTATIGGQTVTTSDGYLRGSVPFGSAPIADIQSNDRFQSERIVIEKTNGDSALTFTYAPRKPSATIDVNETVLQSDAVEGRVYRIPSNTAGDRLNAANWPRYDAIWLTKQQNIYSALRGIHTVPTFNEVTIYVNDTASISSNLSLPCLPLMSRDPSVDSISVRLAFEAAQETKQEFESADYHINIITGPPTVQQISQTNTRLRPTNGSQIACAKPDTDPSTNLTYFGTISTPLASIARGPRASVPHFPGTEGSIKFAFKDELYEFHAGAFAEDTQNRGSWFDEFRSGISDLKPFDRDVVRLVNNYFARGVQLMRETQAAAGQTVQPGYGLFLPGTASFPLPAAAASAAHASRAFAERPSGVPQS